MIRWKRWLPLLTLVATAAACDQVTSAVGENNTAPVASAGADQDVSVGATVQLDASGSRDAEGDVLTYSWSLTTRPDSSGATVANATSSSASFVADVPGTYAATVEVSDGNSSSSDVATITASYDTQLSGTIAHDTVLADLGRPYDVVGDVMVNATLTIAAGVTLRFEQGTRLTVGSGGALVAVGTEADSIRFVGSQSQAGWWEGIEFGTSNGSNELTFVVVSDAGANSWADVYVQSTGSVKISHSSLRNSQTNGLFAESGASIAGFAANAFSANTEASVSVPVAAVGSLDGGSTYGGATDRIEVRGGTLSQASQWPATEVPYLFTADASLENAVAVAAGAQLHFDAGTRVIVMNGGSLSAVGTATDTIRFVGEQDQAGYWEGIEFNTNSTANELTYAEVANGGANTWADVYVQSGAFVKISHSELRGSASYGVFVENNASLAGFAANAFHDNATASLDIPTSVMGQLDDASDYGSGADRIDVFGGAVTTAATWPKTDQPFHFGADASVEGAITVQAGAAFEFAQDVRLIVTADGSLSAVGTATDTIRFVGDQDVTGHWEGIEFANNKVANELTYAEVANGGANGWSNVYVKYSGSVTVTHSLIRDSGTDGLFVELNGTLAGFAENSFASNVAMPLSIPTAVMGQLDDGSTYAGANGTDYITVRGGSVTTAQTWPKTDAPFYFDGTDPSLQADITVQPGATFLFAQDVRLVVTNGGSLYAVGTAADTIRFLGEQPTAGYFEALEFGTTNVRNVLDYTEVGYGGAGGWSNVHVDYDGSVTVNHSYIHDSANYGIEVDLNGSFITNGTNTYASNASGNTN